MFLTACLCQRKLNGAQKTHGHKRYVVYIVKSNQSSKEYDNWLCGGALISSYQVLTAASCLTEVTHVYVIAGNKKYVNGRGIEFDDCTRKRKNRVIKTCVPKANQLTYTEVAPWMTVDIGVAVVEHPYNFSDQSWLRDCSYIPKSIRISYDETLQLPGRDVVAFGWGGTFWRLNTDVLDNNAGQLQEIASLISNKKRCVDSFDGQNVKRVILETMVCVDGQGNLDGSGALINIGPTTRQGCRRSGNDSACRSDIASNETQKVILNQKVPTRRQALCQNDHGGPLVTWIGSEEVLIGVACTGIVDAYTQICIAPSIFTSTYCTGKVVACLTAMTAKSRRRCADLLKSDGLSIHDSDVDWREHDGY